MTYEEIKAAILKSQPNGRVDNINVRPFCDVDGRLIVSFTCYSYSSTMVEIEKLYTIKLAYMTVFPNTTALVGFVLTPIKA